MAMKKVGRNLARAQNQTGSAKPKKAMVPAKPMGAMPMPAMKGKK